MLKHQFRKFAGLLILYSIIIVGIFVMQFRSDSVISHSIGPMSVTLAQVVDSSGNISLKNTLQVSFKGIKITADDVNPVNLYLQKSSDPIPLMLLSWEQSSPLSCVFHFTDSTSLTFSLSDNSQNAALSISASIPKEASHVSLSYKPQSGYSVTEQTAVRQLLNSKKLSYIMTASNIRETFVSLNNSTGLNLAIYNPKTSFSFASINTDAILALEETYNTTLSAYRDSIISTVTSSMHDFSSFTESSIVAYVAEMGIRGKYTEAINKIPDTFKKGSKRTYLSSPYFNSLATTNQSLVMTNQNLEDMTANSIQQSSPDVFAVSLLPDYILRNTGSKSIEELVKIPASITEDQLTLPLSTGILNTYVKLQDKSSSYASYFESVIPMCISYIEKCITEKEEDHLILIENENKVGFIQTIETGSVLRLYGLLSGNSIYTACGNILINTAFENETNLDARILSDLYPVLVRDNSYYPHFAIIGHENGRDIWAWTVANNITYTSTPANTILNISFKQGDTQYLIINNIKPFIGIEIYGMSFHTDARFEVYNSSGYIYDAKSQTLFLKSRHKSAVEQIKLTYIQDKPVKTEEPKEDAAQPQQQIQTEYKDIPKSE